MAPASQASSSPVQSASLLDRFSFPKPLALGYLGLLLFMVGDGIESGYLAPFLLTKGLSQGQVAVMFAVYGVAAAMAGTRMVSRPTGNPGATWSEFLGTAAPRHYHPAADHGIGRTRRNR